jgi:glycosyltransferase involved in cell wall biosynthesis
MVSLLKRVVRRLGGRPLVRLRRRRLRPVLTVVMPVHDVAEYLPAALDSVLAQTLADLEVIAVDDGSADGSLEVLRAYERRDPRVRVLTQDHAGQGPARNLAVPHARGEFLAFVDADDVVPPRAFAHMVDRLRQSGSDFCVGSVRRFRNQEYRRTIWARTVHARDRTATTLTEFPHAMQDIIACNRVFRTAFWRDRVGGFPVGIAYEDHVPMLTAYVRARTFDILREVTYDWRIRENRTSTSQEKGRLQNLRDRVAVKDDALALLDAEASDFVRDLWIGRTLDVDFPPFIAPALAADDEYRALLATTYRKFLDLASDRALEHVTVRQKIRAELVAAGRWDDVAQVNAWLDDVGMAPPATVVDGTPVAVVPPTLAGIAELPPRVLRLSALECHFEGVAQHVVWADDAVRIDGWAYLRCLGISGRTARLTGWLVDEDGRRLDVVAVEPVLLPEANIWSRQPFAAYDGAGFVATVPLAALPSRRARWSLHLEVGYDGLTGSGPLLERVHESAATRPGGTAHPNGGTVRHDWDPADGLCLVVDPAATAVAAPTPAIAPGSTVLQVGGVELDGGTLAVEVVGDLPDRDRQALALAHDRVRLPLLGTTRSSTGWRLEYSVIATDTGRVAPSGRYTFTRERTDARAAPVTVVTGAYAGHMPQRLYGAEVNVKVAQAPDGRLHLDLQPPLPPDALGAPNRRRLRDEFRTATPAPRDAVLFWCGDGAAAAGLPAALDRELAARRPDLTRVWTVADRSVLVPAGAQPVLADSPEWYDALAACRFLCGDTDLEPFFTPKTHQRALRTFADVTAEEVGLGRWQRSGLSEDEVRRELARVQRQWDTVLVPQEATGAVVRAQYRWDGPLLVAAADGPELAHVVATFFAEDAR